MKGKTILKPRLVLIKPEKGHLCMGVSLFEGTSVFGWFEGKPRGQKPRGVFLGEGESFWLGPPFVV